MTQDKTLDQNSDRIVGSDEATFEPQVPERFTVHDEEFSQSADPPDRRVPVIFETVRRVVRAGAGALVMKRNFFFSDTDGNSGNSPKRKSQRTEGVERA